MGAARLTLAALLLAAGCRPAPHTIVLAASSSVSDAGLLDSLVARFRRERPGIAVRTLVGGSGRLLEGAGRGESDVLLVQAPEAEVRFIRRRPSAERTPLMYNDFLLVGPPEDPAGIAGLHDPRIALARISEAGATFVSRGDGSGTHEREAALWREAGITPDGAWYVAADGGQGTALGLADRRRAYALTDRATFAALEAGIELRPLVQGHVSLVNLYSVILPGGSRHAADAAVFAGWLTSVEGRRAIADYRHDRAGFPLFAPLVVGRSLPFSGHEDGSAGREPATAPQVTPAVP